MNTRLKILLLILALLTAFASGRYSVQTPTVHTVATIQTNTDTQTAQDKHEKTVIIKTPDGTTTTTITDDVVIDTKETENQLSKLDQTITSPKINTLNLSILAGMSIHELKPIYGASVTKHLVGPVTIGAYGLTNGVVGVSLGLNF